MIKAFIALITALPEIIKLINNLQKQQQIKQDIKAINKAFKDKDAASLNDIFNR